MSRPIRLALLALALGLSLLPLGAARPGQPATLKADEPAYLLMALSLAEDGDLLCEPKDIQRGFDHYPYLPLDNLILMSSDGWNTVQFGKPYIYSLIAAPFAKLLGPNGFASLNMLLLMAMVYMGATYLAAFNAQHLAALFSSAFFLLSPAFAYVFWIHPEVLNMFSVTACLYLAFHSPPESRAPIGLAGFINRALADPRLRPAWSAAILSIAVYNKPMLALLGVPAVWIASRRRGLRGAAAFLAGGLLGIGLIAGMSTLLTDRPTAYLGAARSGLKVLSPDSYPESVEKLRGLQSVREGKPANSWEWMFRIPTPAPGQVGEDVFYFLLGRHTGLVPYMPFAVLALLLFLLHSRASPERWLMFGALAATALVFLIWIPFNWHGGGGFIGNRYYINAYPGFLFLVTAIRPTGLTWATVGYSALMLGSILFTPWGAAVPHPTMQAHVRGGLFPYFPFEIAIRDKIPGYESFGYRGLGVMGRRDRMKVADESNGVVWVQGNTKSELWVYSLYPLQKLIFDVTTWAPDNEIVLEMGKARQALSFRGALGNPENTRRVELVPEEPTRKSLRTGRAEFFYRLVVESSTGHHEHGNMMDVFAKPLFYIGAELRLLGSGDPRELEGESKIDWEQCSIPPQMVSGVGTVDIPVRVRNTGTSTWGMRGARQVNLVYRWLDATGHRLEEPRGNETLYHDVSPGDDITKLMRVTTPSEPGKYRLVFDAIRRRGTLFSTHGGSTCEADVEVLPDLDALDRKTQ